MKLLEMLEKIDRIDQLIRRKATGTPESLARRLFISKRSTIRLIAAMREMGAPVAYSIDRQSYYYEEEVNFHFGFYDQEQKLKKIYGGIGDATDFFLSTTDSGL